jgi:signal transduction histidine kinase
VAATRYQAFRSFALRSVSTGLVRKRPLPVVLYLGSVIGLLAVSGYPTWRVLGVVGLNIGATAFLMVMRSKARCRAMDDRALFGMNMTTIIIQAIGFGLTGGLASPLVPGILGPSVGTLLAFGRSRESTMNVLFVALMAFILAVLPTSIVGLPPVYPYNVVMTACSVAFSLYMLHTSIVALTDAYSRAGEHLEKAREDVVAQTTARTKSLEAIGSKVAHELKNPLAAVKGLVQLLSRNAADDRSRERLAVIGEEVTRMEAILRDYLSFSRPLEDLKPELLDLGTLTDDVIAVLEARAEQAEVTVQRRGGGASLIGDPRRLKEALMNLLANAIEATPVKGSVTVEIGRVGEGAEIMIRDTGKGIAPDVLSRIGTPFFTTRDGGTGLGVVLARAVANHHGGELKYASEVGRGTTVTMILPSHPMPRGSCPHVQAALGG